MRIILTYRSGCPARETARAKMTELKEGDGVILPLPPVHPARVIARKALAHIAHGLWGVGAYSIRDVPEGALIVRKKRNAVAAKGEAA